VKNTRISNLKYAAAPLALGLALISTPSFAQDAAAEEETVEAIVVTGSLITNPNLERSAPVNVTSAEEMELLQSNLAEEVLVKSQALSLRSVLRSITVTVVHRTLTCAALVQTVTSYCLTVIVSCPPVLVVRSI
jgi:outer membrane receptor for ferrienterochelin and colicin